MDTRTSSACTPLFFEQTGKVSDCNEQSGGCDRTCQKAGGNCDFFLPSFRRADLPFPKVCKGSRRIPFE